MLGIQFSVLDIETSGLSTKYHDILEIAIIRASTRVQINRIIKAKSPETASFDALRITGKTEADLYKGIDIEDAIKDINSFFNEDGLTPAHRCIVGHSVSFDRRFLHSVWEKYDQEFPALYWLDTLSMSKALAKSKGLIKPTLKLHAACDLFGVKKTTAKHNAKDDTKSTYYLWQKLMEENIDHLKFIKAFPHKIIKTGIEEELNIDLNEEISEQDDY